jgi:glycosyltransferase involved in cell wall biosynthesis
MTFSLWQLFAKTAVSLPIVKLSILMPVYNEQATLVSAIKDILNVNFPCEYELVVVDDGSTDGTRELYPSLADDPRVRAPRSAPRPRPPAVTT